MAFEFAYTLDGSAPIIQTFVVKDTVVLSKGEMVNLEPGGGATSEIDAGASGDVAFAGVAAEDCDNTNDGLSCKVIVNETAVYRVTDANIRGVGDPLDLSADGLGVTTAGDNDLIVVEDSTASEPTLVTFNGTHYLQV